jgi:hypothetical protein
VNWEKGGGIREYLTDAYGIRWENPSRSLKISLEMSVCLSREVWHITVIIVLIGFDERHRQEG